MSGALTVTSGSLSEQPRSFLAQSTLRFPIAFTDFRVWDAVQTLLPGTSSADDLGLYGGTWGTNPMKIQTSDLKTLGAVTRYARVEVPIPECYVAGQSIAVIIAGYMTTAVADASCTVDVEAYRRDKTGGISADLCATAAQSINSLTPAEKSFTITPTTFTPGDVMEIRIAIACNDAAGASAVIPTISAVDLSCACKG